jgi:hypothetical protein
MTSRVGHLDSRYNSMKLVFIGDMGLDLGLTLGKVYEIINKFTSPYTLDINNNINNYVFLINDHGDYIECGESSFKTLEDFRNEKLLTILAN